MAKYGNGLATRARPSLEKPTQTRALPCLSMEYVQGQLKTWRILMKEGDKVSLEYWKDPSCGEVPRGEKDGSPVKRLLARLRPPLLTTDS
jgi:hypothetical protein